jgi:hypothetical protein
LLKFSTVFGFGELSDVSRTEFVSGEGEEDLER